MLNQLIQHPYLLLIPLSILEGPIIAIVCGVAAALGYLNPLIAWGILVLGDLLPDLMYYSLGRLGATMPWVKRAATHIRLVREHLPPLEHLWRARLYPTLTTVKLAWGISPALIVSAGLSGVPAGRFAIASLIISIPYLGILLGSGYGLAETYGALRFSPWVAEFVVSAGGLVFLVGLMWAVRRARNELDPARARRQSRVILPETSK